MSPPGRSRLCLSERTELFGLLRLFADRSQPESALSTTIEAHVRAAHPSTCQSTHLSISQARAAPPESEPIHTLPSFSSPHPEVPDLSPPPLPARTALPCSWVLLLLLTVSVALRSDGNADNDVTAALGSLPWLECLAPLWLLDLLYAGVAGYVAANTVAGRFVMAPTQGLCFALLVAALTGSTVAEMLLTGDHRYGGGWMASSLCSSMSTVTDVQAVMRSCVMSQF